MKVLVRGTWAISGRDDSDAAYVVPDAAERRAGIQSHGRKFTAEVPSEWAPALTAGATGYTMPLISI